MKNIILIDLTVFNYQKLEEVSKTYNFDYKCLVDNKKNGVSKIWIDTENGSIIAYSTKEFKDNIFMTEIFMTSLDKIKPVEIIKQPKVLSIDIVLDKITKYGVDSLNENEKRFLESQ